MVNLSLQSMNCWTTSNPALEFHLIGLFLVSGNRLEHFFFYYYFFFCLLYFHSLCSNYAHNFTEICIFNFKVIIIVSHKLYTN